MTENPLGFCTVCVRVRWLAVVTDEAGPKGVCTQCDREQAENLVEFVRPNDEFAHGLGDFDAA